jgi:carbonic anhydrase
LLASAEPGELFIMRNVGNLIPPAKDDGMSSGDYPRPVPSNMPFPSSR